MLIVNDWLATLEWNECLWEYDGVDDEPKSSFDSRAKDFRQLTQEKGIRFDEKAGRWMDVIVFMMNISKVIANSQIDMRESACVRPRLIEDSCCKLLSFSVFERISKIPAWNNLDLQLDDFAYFLTLKIPCVDDLFPNELF